MMRDILAQADEPTSIATTIIGQLWEQYGIIGIVIVFIFLAFGLFMYYLWKNRRDDSSQVETFNRLIEMQFKERGAAQTTINESFVSTQTLVTDLNREMREVKDALTAETIERVRLEERSKSRDEKLQELLNTIQKRDATIVERDETIAARDVTIMKLESSINALENEKAQLLNERDKLNLRIDELTEEIGRLNARLDLKVIEERRANTQPIPLLTQDGNAVNPSAPTRQEAEGLRKQLDIVTPADVADNTNANDDIEGLIA